MKSHSTRNVWLLLFLLLVLLFAGSFVAGRLGLLPEAGMSLAAGKVAVVYVAGVLEDASAFLEEFDAFKDREDVKAIVVRIDSPGGTIVPAQEIFEEIRKARGKKTVLVSMGNVAASAGYYVACAAEEIWANPGSLTGSIGVITVVQNYRELMNKIGFKMRIMKAGEFKDMGNPMREMTPEEVRIEQTMLDNLHRQFIRDVALGRNRTEEEILPLADGRAYTGEQALELGLVDQLGNLQDTINRAAELSGIEGKPEVVYPEEKRPSLWEFVVQSCLNWIQLEAGSLWKTFQAGSRFAPFLQ